MVHGYSIDTWKSMFVFSINGYSGMDIAWTLLKPGCTNACYAEITKYSVAWYPIIFSINSIKDFVFMFTKTGQC